jgi:L,D-transpeptidase YcbB
VKKSLPILFLILFSACKDDQEGNFETSNMSMPEKLEMACSDDYLAEFIPEESDRDFLIDLYTKNKFKPLWYTDTVLNQKGIELEKLARQPLRIGIPNKIKLLQKTDNYLQHELALSLAAGRTIRAAQNGFLDFEKNELKQLSPSSIDTVLRFVREFRLEKRNRLYINFKEYLPKDTAYHQLLAGLNYLLDRLPYDTTHFDVKTIKQDSIQAISVSRKALISKGYLFEKQMFDTIIYDSVLRVFQVDNGLNPDGVIGKFTAKALNESSAEKFHRVILSMEKIRNREKYPSKFILINLPEYKLRFFESDTLRSEHRVIIGTPENSTPELTSKLNKIVVYPYWSVPYSISSKEILPAVKRDVSYLTRNNYKIYRKDVLVDPYSVNWQSIRQNSFPYKVVQDPGPKNSLGILKFDFPNNYSVYFHDTPSKGLFGADIRAYSHGCMRTHKPIDLAKKILEYDSIPRKRNEVLPDTLDSLLARQNNYEIRLLDRIPIFIIYQTVAAEGNALITYPDIYGRDEKYLKVLL